jgi:Flp pilus assembly protein TadG
MDRRHRKHRSHGQAMVEFVIVVPIVLLLIFALFDVGRSVVFYTELTNAARVGARVAMVNQSNDPTCGGAEQTFKCAAAGITTTIGLAPASIADVTISGTDCDAIANCEATVTLNHAYVPITPLIDSLMGPFNISASTTMPIERLYSSP